MLKWFEDSLIFGIIILAILCLIMTPKKGHPEIYDTTIDLRKPDTTVYCDTAIAGIDTLKLEHKK